jgi:hypothetical protein
LQTNHQQNQPPKSQSRNPASRPNRKRRPSFVHESRSESKCTVLLFYCAGVSERGFFSFSFLSFPFVVRTRVGGVLIVTALQCIA